MQPVHVDVGLTLSQFLGSLPTFVAVILAWLYVNKRLNDAKGELKESIKSEATLIRAEMRRVEDVIDARLKHLEDEKR